MFWEEVIKDRWFFCRDKMKLFIDRALNTISWFFAKKNEIIVLNVWLRHRRERLQTTNLGDDLNWFIVKKLTGKKIVAYRYSFLYLFNPINYMCIGSIVDTLTNKNSIIWGSGAMYGDPNRQFIPPHKVLAVRGPRTRDYLLSKGIDCPNIYGDPAILLPLLYTVETSKKYKIGIIPHIADLKDEKITRFIDENRDIATLINLRNYKSWTDIINQICECDFVLSSSLHGIIIADAYGVPNFWITFSDKVKGDGFKYYDYFEGCNRKIEGPYDLSEDEISYNFFKSLVPFYTRPDYDTKSLLKACPFISTYMLEELEKKATI